MKRNLFKLAEQQFDVLIIGGGIYGAAIAREISRDGFKTALIEKEDFSHATSANSLKIIHGGFRYLQHLNFKRMRESIVSRREMMRIAPHLVKKLACIMPTYGHGLKGKELMSCALFLNDLISWDRNHLIKPDNHIPSGKILTKEECLKVIQNVNRTGLNGAAQWYDGIALNTERLTLTFIMEASQHGACVANYVKAIEPIIHNSQLIGVKAKDSFSDEQFEIHAKITVNATGPWLEKSLLIPEIGNERRQKYAKAINIIVKKPLFSETAVCIEGSKSYVDKDAFLKKGKRFYFFVPWRGYTMIGTSYKPYKGDPDNFNVEAADIEEIIAEVNTIYAAAELAYEDVTFYHAGMLPMAESTDLGQADVQLDKSYKIIDHKKKSGIKGLISVKGVKYTTALQVAIATKKIICQQIKASGLTKDRLKEQQTLFRLPPSAGLSQNGSSRNKVGVVAEHLDSTYGQYAIHLRQYKDEDSHPGEWVSKNPPLTTAEIIYSIREEMALKLSDVVFRRTGLGTAECPPLSILNKVAEIAAKELGWDHMRKTEEIEDVLLQYSPLKIM